AAHVVDASAGDSADQVRAFFPAGVQVAVDALGSIATAAAGARSLAVRGRHVQVGLLPPAVVGDRATVPMHTVIGRELQVLGSHGMPAVDYPRMLEDVASDRLRPELFLGRTITLDEAPEALVA